MNLKATLKRNTKELGSPFANSCRRQYNSVFTEKVKARDPVRRLLPKIALHGKYGPDENGWDGYCCLAYGFLGYPSYGDDYCGATVRHVLFF